MTYPRPVELVGGTAGTYTRDVFDSKASILSYTVQDQRSLLRC